MKRFFLIIGICLFVIGQSIAFTGPVPDKVFQEMCRIYQEISDYQCRINEWCIYGGQYEKKVINLFFKKPRLIRMDILDGNRPFDKGSVGIFKGGAEVIGHRGGIMSGVVIKVEKHNPLVTSIRGVTIDQSDFEGILQSLSNHLKNSAISIGAPENNTYQFVGISNQSSNIPIKEVIKIDAKTFLPMSADLYEMEKLMQHVEWSDYILNAGLPDQLFEVGFNPDNLARLGIPSIQQLPLSKEHK